MFKLNLIERARYINNKSEPREAAFMIYVFASIAINILICLMFLLIIAMLVMHLENEVFIQQFEVLGFIVLLILAILMSLGKAETIGDKNV